MAFTPSVEQVRAKRREYMRQWRAADRNRERIYKMRSRYGIDADEYQRIHDAQGGVCAICGNAETSRHSSGAVKSLAIDHCHESGDVRGLLCHRCNRVLGLLGDDPDLIRVAAEYVEMGGAR